MPECFNCDKEVEASDPSYPFCSTQCSEEYDEGIKADAELEKRKGER